MQVNVEKLEGLECKITVQVPSEKIDQAVEKKLKSLSGKVKMPGFRQGKVPGNVIRKQYGTSVRGEVINEVLGTSYTEALQQESLKPVNVPKMNLLKNEEGQPIEYEAIFEVYPTVELKSLDNVKVDGYKVTVTDKDVEDMMENIRKQNVQWNEVDRAAKNEDRVDIDFDSKIDGKPFQGGSGKNVSLVLGTKSAIPGFEEGIVGKKAGDELSLNLTFPDDYAHKGVAGKDTVADIKVHKVFEAQLPELNEDFATKLGVKEGGLEGLKKQVRESLEKEIDKLVKNNLKSKVLKEFAALHKVQLPLALVDQEIQKLKQQALAQMPKDKRPDPEKLPREAFEKPAIQRVGLALLFNEFAKTNDIKLDKDRVEKTILEFGASSGDPQAVLKWYRSNKQQMQMVESTVMEEQIVEALVERVTVVDKEISYVDFMKEHQQQNQPQPQTQEKDQK
jgi:trigger factor